MTTTYRTWTTTGWLRSAGSSNVRNTLTFTVNDNLTCSFVASDDPTHVVKCGQMQTHELKRAMGLQDKEDWPQDGMSLQVVGNVMVYVLRANVARRRHRAFAICEACQRSIPAGRFHQHRRACKAS